MIRGYPGTPSLYPGDQLVLHVSTDAPRFRVELWRQGGTLEHMADGDSPPQTGALFPDGPPDLDWGWPGYALAKVT